MLQFLNSSLAFSGSCSQPTENIFSPDSNISLRSLFLFLCHLNVHYLCTLFLYSSISQKLSMFLTKDSAIELKQRGILCQMEDFQVSNVCWTVSKINMVTHNNYNQVHFFYQISQNFTNVLQKSQNMLQNKLYFFVHIMLLL